MRYALISDIHGNLPALEAVLADIDERSDLGGVYHLGDLVGYAPWPDEVAAVLRERAIPGVAGNYDSTTATDYKHCGCKYEDPRQEELSHHSYEWTRATVSEETKRWLGSLPFRIDIRPLGGHTAGPRLILVHGNPVLNTVYWTEDRSDKFCLQMAEQLGAKEGDLIAFGHTHKPWHRTIEGIHFVNTGSVGRPKDGTGARATCWSPWTRSRWRWSSCGSSTTSTSQLRRSARAICRTSADGEALWIRHVRCSDKRVQQA